MSARIASCAAVLVLTIAGLAAPARASVLAPRDRQSVDAAVQQVMQSARVPGMSVRISGPMGTYARAYGVGDRATGAPMALTDHVRIASNTKTFTATAVLRQVQRGHLSLSDRLSRWVKGIPNGRRITIRQLLGMRSGIYDYTADRAFDRRFEADPLMSFGARDVIRIIRRHKPLFAPGARTQYADSNYYLLGIILQKVTGRSVESVITKDVIRRAGLRETSFPTTAAMPDPFARGYYAGPDGQASGLRDLTASNPRVAWTAGAMISTVDDLYAWGRALATGTLLSKRLQAQRLRFGNQPNPGGPPVGYGLGILRVGDWVGHNGAIFGYGSVTFYDRSTGAQIVVVENLASNEWTPAMDVFVAIAQRLYPESLR